MPNYFFLQVLSQWHAQWESVYKLSKRETTHEGALQLKCRSHTIHLFGFINNANYWILVCILLRSSHYRLNTYPSRLTRRQIVPALSRLVLCPPQLDSRSDATHIFLAGISGNLGTLMGISHNENINRFVAQCFLVLQLI